MAEHGSLQKMMASELLAALFPSDLPGFFAVRIARVGLVVPRADMAQAISRNKKRKPEISFACAISWAAGWITSRRMQDPHTQECLFGCWGAGGGSDAISHYPRCAKIWQMMEEVAPGTEASPEGRWALLPCGSAEKRDTAAAVRLAAVLHAHRSMRLDMGLYEGRSSLQEAMTVAEHGAAMRVIATAAAHKFGCNRGERHGARAALHAH